jgi:hypothetical protein
MKGNVRILVLARELYPRLATIRERELTNVSTKALSQIGNNKRKGTHERINKILDIFPIIK